MTAIILGVYGIYLVLVGARGNAPTLLSLVSQESQFLYWVLVLIVVAGLWESQSGQKLAKPFAALIVLGFLLKNQNWKQIATGAKQVLPAL